MKFSKSITIPVLQLAALISTALSVFGFEALPDLSKVPTPPSFVHEPNDRIIYFVVQTSGPTVDNALDVNGDSLKKVTLNCKASGCPKVDYYWQKNNTNFSYEGVSRIQSVAGEGTLILTKLEPDDAGFYRCFAYNGNGTAVDSPIELMETYTRLFDHKKPEIISVEVGKPFSRSCVPPPSFPQATATWYLKSDGSQITPINSNHIVQNNKGVIFFTYLEEADKHRDLYYTCFASNPVTNEMKLGEAFTFRFDVSSRKTLPFSIRPTELHLSESEIIVVRGETAYFYCVFAGYPDSVTKPQWLKLSGEIPRDRAVYRYNERSMEIKDVDIGDEGDYVCSLPDYGIERKFRLSVEAAPYWLSQQSNVNASEGDDVTFTCNASGIPAPRFQFFKNGQRLESNSLQRIDHNKLTLYSIRKETPGVSGDNAVYQCEADNKHGKLFANFYLNIISFKPYILDWSPHLLSKVVGDEIELFCKIFGSPLPIVNWNYPPTLDASRVQIATTDKDKTVSMLTIRNAKSTDGGEFSCIAQNKYGIAEASSSLTLKNSTVIMEGPRKEVVRAGSSVSFDCAADHDTSLNLDINWLFNNEPLTGDGKSVRRSNDGSRSTLTIDRVSKESSGNYTCLVKTELDKREQTGLLLVKDVPSAPTRVTVVECTDASAAIKWSHFDNPVQLADTPVESFIVQKQSSLYAHVWDSAASANGRDNSATVGLDAFANFSFRVIARNEIGDSAPSEPSISICRTPPKAPETNPENVLVRGSTPNDLTIYWEPVQRKDWNGPNFHYEVRYRKAGSSEFTTINVTDPYASHVVVEENIEGPYHMYEVQVLAVNAQGPSTVAPNLCNGHSGEGVPSVAPEGFRFLGTNGTVASFQWNAVDEESVKGNFKGYKITYWADGEKRKEAYFDKSASVGVLYDMYPYRENKAFIQVLNGAHVGPQSDILSFTMSEGVPSEVQGLVAFGVSGSVIGLVWLPPARSNGILFGYSISWGQLETIRVKRSVSVSSATVAEPTLTYYRVSSLLPASEYRITVRALSQGGLGLGDPASVDATTLPSDLPITEPEVPVLRVGGLAETEANVTWIPGQYDATRRRPVGDSFFFRYRPEGGREWQDAHAIGDNFTVTLAQLQSGKTYEVVAVSVVKSADGDKITTSPPYTIRTLGDDSPSSAIAWIIAVIVAILILVVILITVCLMVRNRGAKYPVHEKERAQGRQLTAEERGFGEYKKPIDEEKRSLTGGSMGESDSDSITEYADGEAAKFTEDGSFIGQYGNPNRTFQKDDQHNANASTFV